MTPNASQLGKTSVWCNLLPIRTRLYYQQKWWGHHTERLFSYLALVEGKPTVNRGFFFTKGQLCENCSTLFCKVNIHTREKLSNDKLCCLMSPVLEIMLFSWVYILIMTEYYDAIWQWRQFSSLTIKLKNNIMKRKDCKYVIWMDRRPPDCFWSLINASLYRVSWCICAVGQKAIT